MGYPGVCCDLSLVVLIRLNVDQGIALVALGIVFEETIGQRFMLVLTKDSSWGKYR